MKQLEEKEEDSQKVKKDDEEEKTPKKSLKGIEWREEKMERVGNAGSG